jgi:hypothetical protein
MREVTVTYIKSKEKNQYKGFLFEGKKDLELVDSFLNGRVKTAIEKWDGSNSDEFSYSEKAIIKCYEGMSSISISKSLELYKGTLTSMLEKDQAVFINPSGGLCPFEGTLEIVE